MNSSTKHLSQMFHKFHCPKFDWCATTAVGADVVVPFSVLQVHRRVQSRPRHPHKNVLVWENIFCYFFSKTQFTIQQQISIVNSVYKISFCRRKVDNVK